MSQDNTREKRKKKKKRKLTIYLLQRWPWPEPSSPWNLRSERLGQPYHDGHFGEFGAAELVMRPSAYMVTPSSDFYRLYFDSNDYTVFGVAATLDPKRLDENE